MARNQIKAGAKGRTKGGKRKKDSTDAAINQEMDRITASHKAPEPNWGLFEPLRGPLGPVATLVSAPTLIALLLFSVFFLWWRGPGKGGEGVSYGSGSAQRVAAYEEIWRREESELWKWLEERAGLEGAVPGFLGGQSEEKRKWLEKQRVKDMKESVGDGGGLGERQMKEAIRVTRERLEALEKAVGGHSGEEKMERRNTV